MLHSPYTDHMERIAPHGLRTEEFKRTLEDAYFSPPPGMAASVVDPDKLIDRICKRFGITREEFVGPRRFENFVEARRQFMKIMCRRTDMPLKAIGGFCDVDHTTVMHNRDKGSPFRFKARCYRRALQDITASQTAYDAARRWEKRGWLWL